MDAFKGKPYKNFYVIYARKSTDDINNQKNSISYQKAEEIKFAKREQLPIAPLDIPGFCTSGIISEKHTGFKEDNNFIITKDGMIQFRIERPKFQKLIELLHQGEFKGVIFLCWDRASRNRNDDTILRKLGKRGIDVRYVEATYDKSSSGELHMDVDGMFAQHYSRVISEKVTNTTRKLRAEGICTYRAPVGYLNLGDPRHKPFDPLRAPIVKQLFEKYADGKWSLADLAKWANEQGLVMPAVRRPRTEAEMLSDEEIEIEAISRPINFKQLQWILTNPFYTGKVLSNDGQYMRSQSHEALIDDALFATVSKMLKQKQVSVHYIEKLSFPYRGLIRCALCNRVYTPYEQKGIHYYGARCAKDCKNTKKNINAAFIESKVIQALNELSYTEEELAEIDLRTQNDILTFEEKRKKVLEEKDRQKRKINEEVSYLRENKLLFLKTGVYTPESYLNEELQLNAKLEKLSLEEQASNLSMLEIIKDSVFLSELLKDICLYSSLAKSKHLQEIILKVFSELLISGNTLVYQCKNGFEALEKRFFLLGDPTLWTSEGVRYNTLIKISIADLQGLMEDL